MSIKNDATMIIGLGLGVVLIAWYVQKKADDTIKQAGQTIRTAWESAKTAGADVIESVAETVVVVAEKVAPTGAALYDNRAPVNRGVVKKTEFTLGDINDGAIY